MKNLFNRFSTGCARFTGRPEMLFVCVGMSIVGFIAYFSGDEHFLGGANIGISVITLMLLPILQATQNRDGAALQAKLDELIKVNSDARDALIGLEHRDVEEIERVRASHGGGDVTAVEASTTVDPGANASS